VFPNRSRRDRSRSQNDSRDGAYFVGRFQTGGQSGYGHGDMVLQEDQVNPVLSIALDNGIEVTALHNHFLWDTPK